jgi:small GTP-binding protein
VKNLEANKSNAGSSLIAKVVLLGDGAVGKTSIRKRYMGAGFQTMHLMTLGADFSQKDLITKNQKVSLQIWDIAGQEYFNAIRKRFLADASTAILIFDLSRRESFQGLEYWLQEIWEVYPDYNLPLLICGNKNDLEDERKVNEVEVTDYINQVQQTSGQKTEFLGYIETSALTGENIDKAFELIVNDVFKKKSTI